MNDLVSRWRDDMSLTKQVIRRLQSGRDLSALVDSVAGRADLRGFVFPTPRVIEQMSIGDSNFLRTSKKLQFRNVAWDSIDFSGATLSQVMFFGSTLRNLKLDGANLNGSGIWGCHVLDTEFISCDLQGFCISSDKDPSTWEGSLVNYCDLRDAAMWSGTFDKTEFRSIKTNGLNVRLCSFRDARFTGPLDRINFDNRQLGGLELDRELRVDFSEADLRDISFRGWKFADVTLPKGAGWFSNQLAVSRRVVEALEQDSTDDAKMVLAVVRNMMHGVDDENTDGYFNRAEWGRYGKGNGALLLYEATLNAVLGEMGLQIHWGGTFNR